MTPEQEQEILNSQWVINTVMKEMGCQGDEDIKSLATITLCKYIEKFDATRGVKWTTYAYKCVQSVITRELMKRYEDNSKCVSDSLLFYVEDSTNYEEQAITNMTLDTILSQLNNKDKYILNARLNDVPFQQIANSLHISRQSVLNHWKHIRELCLEYFTPLS